MVAPAFCTGASGLLPLVLRQADLLLFWHAELDFDARGPLSRLASEGEPAIRDVTKKIPKIGVDAAPTAFNFITPRKAGTPLIKEFVLRTFGTANWTQFCPGMIFGNEY